MSHKILTLDKENIKSSNIGLSWKYCMSLAGPLMGDRAHQCQGQEHSACWLVRPGISSGEHSASQVHPCHCPIREGAGLGGEAPQILATGTCMQGGL